MARRVLQVSTSLALVALAVLVVFQWRIGPVVAVLSPGHGIHSGDSLGVGAMAVGWLLWPRRPVHRLTATTATAS